MQSDLNAAVNDRRPVDKSKSKKISLGGACVIVEDFEPDVRATMPSRPSGDRIQVIDSMDTASDSVNKPPNQYTSVDMGMMNAETATADSMAHSTIGSQAIARMKK